MDSASALALGSLSSPNLYVFMPNNLKNTTLIANADLLYTIRTDLVTDTHTYVDDARTGRRIATIIRRDLFPDTVTFSDQRNSGKSISIHKWLQKHKLPDGYPSHVMQTSIGRCVWKSDAAYRLGLYQGYGDHPHPQCVAYLQPAFRTQPLTLFLYPTAEHLRDEILVACLILEHRLRVADDSINVGGGKFEQNKTVFRHYVHS